jgi:hypothetical protein
MNTQLESVHDPERSIILLVDAPDCEYLFGTDTLAVAFPFAAFQIDHRMDDARLAIAGWRCSAHVRPSRRPQRAA